MERANLLLSEKESEIGKIMTQENDMTQKLRDRLEIIEEEKKTMEVRSTKKCSSV